MAKTTRPVIAPWMKLRTIVLFLLPLLLLGFMWQARCHVVTFCLSPISFATM